MPPNFIDQAALRGRPGGSDWTDRHIRTNDRIAAQDVMFVRPGTVWDVDNPHPGFGTDPNIINELGHTHYPKWVEAKDGRGRVIVRSPDQEEEATGIRPDIQLPQAPRRGNDW